MLGDVGHPQLVWGRSVEPALDQVSGGRHVGLAAEALPGSWQPIQTVQAHDLPHRLAVDDYAVAVGQLGVDPPPAVGAMGVSMDGVDQLGQPGKPELAWRGRTAPPHEEPRGSHPKNPAASLGGKALPGHLSDDRVLVFWAHPLLKQRRSLLDQGQFGLQLLDPAPGRSQLTSLDG
jgi:hypothetical protein